MSAKRKTPQKSEGFLRNELKDKMGRNKNIIL